MEGRGYILIKSMKKIIIAFDVDWTLRREDWNPNSMLPNSRIVELLKILSTFKNIKIIVWSWAGQEWADECVNTFNIREYIWKTASKNHQGKVDGKHIFEPDIFPDIAIDDIQDCSLGVLNLIVKEK